MGTTRIPNDGPTGDLALREEAAYALTLHGAERLEALLDSDQPMQVVRSLPDRDLYLTVRQVGIADALPVLALASPDQIQHILDLESWRQDRFDCDRAGAWMAVLLEAGEATFKQFLRHADDELLVALMAGWGRVSQIEFDDQVPIHGAGEGDAGDAEGFAGPDGFELRWPYLFVAAGPDGFHRFSPERPEHAAAVRAMADRLFRNEPERYQRILLDALWRLPSELEEQALQWRQSRLEEHGFPGAEEAMEIYLPPRGVRTEPNRPLAMEGYEPTGSLALFAAEEGWLGALATDLSSAELDYVLHQLGALSNRVLVADHLDTGDPESHQAAVRKAAATVGIALATRFASDGRPAGAVVREVSLLELFREGYARIDAMKLESHRLLHDDWPSTAPDALDLVDPPLRQRLAGLVNRIPLYYQVPIGDTREMFREFQSLDEVLETQTALDLVRRIGSIFVHLLGLDITRLLQESTDFPHGNPRFSTLMMTMMAWHSARMEIRLEPLPGDVLADFLRTVASRRTADDEAPARALTALVRRMTESLELDLRDGAALQGFGQACLPALRAECGQMDPGAPPDQRTVSCLLIR